MDEVRKNTGSRIPNETTFQAGCQSAAKEVENYRGFIQSSVRKRWPALLYVYVVEQTPCALWGMTGCLVFVALFQGAARPTEKPFGTAFWS